MIGSCFFFSVCVIGKGERQKEGGKGKKRTCFLCVCKNKNQSHERRDI
jgi:hypothetical protein